METAKLTLRGQDYELPVFEGSEGEVALDVRNLRAKTGAVAYDPGFGNTGSCSSAITFIDGEQGILRYRGYPIEEIADRRFSEVAYLLIYGELPTAEQQAAWSKGLTYHTLIHEDMKKFFEGYATKGHPMAILSSMVASLSTYYPGNDDSPEIVNLNILRLMAKLKTIAAFAYKKSIGQAFIYPRNDLSYSANFLRMMFAVPAEPYEVNPKVERALNMLLNLHADHEQNCSTSTVRMVASSGANLFASIAAGICALWGPLHGGANQQVIEMLEHIEADGRNYKKYVDMAKDKSSGFKLMGFGHRVYKNFDPRAKILREAAQDVLAEMGIDDPLLEIAQRLEEVALHDPFFVERKLYPNVDFYSGIIYRAMGIPTDMFTVMFALGRLPGWLAHWKELRDDESGRIHRPRQVYTGATERHSG